MVAPMQGSLKENFERDGFIIIENFFPDHVIDKYVSLWKEENHNRPEGWMDGDKGASGTAYLKHPEVLDILCSKDLGDIFVQLEKAVALHVDITYSVSTELGWHQDNNMPLKKSGDNYIGVWVALEDVDPEAGPFQFVPGSHNWDMDYEYLWNKSMNEGVGLDLEDEMERRGIGGTSFMGKKGDVFIWHSRLIHRGSDIIDRSKTRMSLIGHYCNDYANMDEHESIPDFSSMIDDMLTKSLRYAEWGGLGAMYFVNPDVTGYDYPEEDNG